MLFAWNANVPPSWWHFMHLLFVLIKIGFELLDPVGNFHDMNSMHPTDHQPLRTWPFCFFSNSVLNGRRTIWITYDPPWQHSLEVQLLAERSGQRHRVAKACWAEHESMMRFASLLTRAMTRLCCACMRMHVYATSCQSHNSQTLSNICLSPVDTVEPKLWWFCLWGFHLFWQPQLVWLSKPVI